MSTAPPFPEITRRADGALDQTWEVEFEVFPRVPFEAAGPRIAKRAIEMYDALLTAQGIGDLIGLEHTLEVSLVLHSPSSMDVRITSAGDAPNWNSLGAVSSAMAALEETYGRISQFNGKERSVWKLWPLPPNTSLERTREG